MNSNDLLLDQNYVEGLYHSPKVLNKIFKKSSEMLIQKLNPHFLFVFVS